MKSVKGTKTEKNLLAAFAGESQARNRYTYFASVAEKSGLAQIGAIFLETAENEKEHAKRFFKYLEGGDVEITASYPAGVVGDTPANLEAAAAGEHLEWTKLYKESGDIAKQEGFDEIAEQFYNIAKVEVEHEKRYRKLLQNIKEDKVFKKDAVVQWKCRVCGHIHIGNTAPDKCPTCQHGKGFFELRCENY
ncbi:MAG: ferritin family protein [Candidatus Omnitrophica bacterium]|nr:ferritin family protein [Candidatus Omnitrophota bacterium]MDD5672495.1 ferritin family protein [Candidatus Omnitrophota bacterium]